MGAIQCSSEEHIPKPELCVQLQISSLQDGVTFGGGLHTVLTQNGGECLVTRLANDHT